MRLFRNDVQEVGVGIGYTARAALVDLFYSLK